MTESPPYSAIMRTRHLYITSGQIGAVDGELVSPDLVPQVLQALQNLRDVLASEELSLLDVVKTTIFLTSMDDYAEMNRIYTDAFEGHRPARSAVAVHQLPFGARFEIEAWADRSAT